MPTNSRPYCRNENSMLLTTLQLLVDRPHLGRIDVAASVGKPDIAAHIAQVVRELKADAEVPGFRKGKAPLKRVREHYLKDVRARARARLVESPPSPLHRRASLRQAQGYGG